MAATSPLRRPMIKDMTVRDFVSNDSEIIHLYSCEV
jgi:hypothetical protein